MKEQSMIQSPTFEVNLGGIDLTQPQAKELEKAIQQTTMQFLAKLDNGFTDGLLAYKPNPENPEDDGLPEFISPGRRKWWFGFILWKQPKPGQLVQLDRLKASFPDFMTTGTFEKMQIKR